MRHTQLLSLLVAGLFAAPVLVSLPGEAEAAKVRKIGENLYRCKYSDGSKREVRATDKDSARVACNMAKPAGASLEGVDDLGPAKEAAPMRDADLPATPK